MAGIGARTVVRKKIDEGMSIDQVFDYVCKKFPNVKSTSIRRYIDDYKGSIKTDFQNLGDTDRDASGDHSNDTNNDASGDHSAPSNDQEIEIGQVLDMGDFSPAEIKPEGKRIEAMYRDNRIPETTIKLERLPKMITKSINLLRQWGPFKEKLAKWNDKEAIDAVADDAQTVIQNRLRISSKHADVVDLGMSSGNLLLSMFLSIIDPNNKPSEHDKLIDKSIRKEMQEKNPDLLAKIDEFEQTMKNPPTQQNDQTTKPV